MAKKKKKLSEYEMMENFQKWKQSEEYRLLEKIYLMKEELPKLLEITEDITEKWQSVLDEIKKVGPIFKIKGATLKILLQEQLRTAFFGGVHERDEPFKIDDFELDFENKEYPKNCRHVKIAFVDFLKQTDDLDILDEKRYLDWRKNKIHYKYKEFTNFFKEHIKKKKGHDETNKLLKLVLEPLKQLMEANCRLLIFEKKNYTKKLFEENYFKYAGLIKDFCEKYQPCQRILNETSSNKIVGDPDISSVLKKLNYENWEDNEIEKFYFLPLLTCFNKMKANLMKLYSVGINFWKQPLYLNNEFFKDVQNLVENEIRSENLFGNDLSRCQTNFLFDICKKLFFSEVQNEFVNKEKKILEKTIPKLAIFFAMKNMNKVYNKKKEFAVKNENRKTNKEKDKKESDILKIKKNKKLDFSLISFKDPKKEITNTIKGIYYETEIRSFNTKNIKIKIDDTDPKSLKDFGRFFIWFNMLQKNDHMKFIKKSLSLKDFNMAILNDIEDFILVEGKKADPINYMNNRDEAILKMKNLNNLINKEKEEKIIFKRPPYLWNKPDTLKENHNVRFSSNLYNDYECEDINDLHDFIEEYAEKLRNHKKDFWDFLVDSVIEVYVNKDT